MNYNPEYWENKWKNNEIKFHENEINLTLIKYFPKLNLKPIDTILVPLCGKTLDMAWLSQQGVNIIGIELSDIACKDFFISQGVEPKIEKFNQFITYEFKNIKIFCGNIFSVTRNDLPPISSIYDCKALIALPKEVRALYVQHLISLSTVPSNILLLVLEANQEVKGPPYSISEEEIHLLYSSFYSIEKMEQNIIKDAPEHLIPLGWSEGIKKTYLLKTSGNLN